MNKPNDACPVIKKEIKKVIKEEYILYVNDLIK
jgi:uncharacterized protein YaiI (UPF0178 family)